MKRIQVGDRVLIAFDNPPDEWGYVERIYRANEGYYRRALVRQIDGRSVIVPLTRLTILDEGIRP